MQADCQSVTVFFFAILAGVSYNPQCCRACRARNTTSLFPQRWCCCCGTLVVAGKVVVVWRYSRRGGAISSQLGGVVLGFLVAHACHQSGFACMLQMDSASPNSKAGCYIEWQSAIVWFEYVSALLLSNLMPRKQRPRGDESVPAQCVTRHSMLGRGLAGKSFTRCK